MKRFMNRWQDNNGCPCAEGSAAQKDQTKTETGEESGKEEGAPKQEDQENGSPEEEFLFNIGANVKDMLDPLGMYCLSHT